LTPGASLARVSRVATRRALASGANLLLWLAIPLTARAIVAQPAPIEVNPGRPTFATPARTTQLGVAELEFGVQDSFLRNETTAFTSPTLLKLGLARDFDLRISTDGLVHQIDPHGSYASGLTDIALGAQWCFSHRGPLASDVAVQVTRTFPSASARRGIGTGAADTTAALFFSRDLGPNHVDINFLYTWVGLPRASGGGTAHQPAWALSVSHNLKAGWACGGELYGIGATPLGDRVVSTLWYVAYEPMPRLVFDSAIDVGLTHGTPRYSLLAGLTYGIGYFRKP
jgi:hypothetical protein